MNVSILNNAALRIKTHLIGLSKVAFYAIAGYALTRAPRLMQNAVAGEVSTRARTVARAFELAIREIPYFIRSPGARLSVAAHIAHDLFIKASDKIMPALGTLPRMRAGLTAAAFIAAIICTVPASSWANGLRDLGQNVRAAASAVTLQGAARSKRLADPVVEPEGIKRNGNPNFSPE